MEERKRRLRRLVRAARRHIPEDAREAAHRAMAARLDEVVLARGARVVAVYAAMGGEADPSAFDRRWVAEGGVVAFPRVVGPGAMDFRRVDDPDTLVAGYRGIREPPEDAPRVPWEDIDVLVVPGVAFDLQGHRLGQGGGFYDRMLATAPAPYAVGLAYELQVVDHVPRGEHDMQVDAVVTERRTLRFPRVREPSDETR
ncbi:MAG: 5-formyltetrahydrofolate cyclo-ligase [Myxococcota bacterium]